MTAAMRRSDKGWLVESPLLPALISLILFVVAFVFPPTLLLMAAPLYYLLMHEGRVTGGKIIVAVSCLILLVGGMGTLVIYSLLATAPALLLVWSYNDNLTLQGALTRTTSLLYGAGFIFLLVVAQIEGMGIAEMLTYQGDQGLGLLIDAYEESGSTQQMALVLEENRQVQVAEFVSLFPALAFGGVLLVVVVNVLTIRIVSLRTNMGIHFSGRPFREWQAPETLIWPLIGSGFAYWLLSGPGGIIGQNILFSLAAIYLIQGIGVIDFYLNAYNAQSLLRAFVYFFIFSQPLFLLAVSFLGLTDVWANFRNINGEENDTSGPDASL